MRSFGSSRGRVLSALVLTGWVGWAGWLAQPALAQVAPGERYEATRADEQRIFASTAARREEFRAVIAGYWNIVRFYPASGYTDNALWQAAATAQEAYRRFGDDRDRQTAVRMLQWLDAEYPHSPLASRAASELSSLSPTTPPLATPLRAIERTSLPEVVRITVELEREVPFYQERLSGPERLFFDLKGTSPVDALRDAVLRFDDDIVREIRLGRHPNGTTRVVLDLEGVRRYSVFTLYNPYRIVIDCERAAEPPLSAGRTSRAPAGPAPTESTAASSLPPRAPEGPTANTAGGFSVARQLGLGVSTIVIDPGHGGHDPGATAFGVSEADLVLDVALRLEKLLLRERGLGVVLTRRTNEYVPLEQRTQIANREAADLFLSIHANASANGRAEGVETYFLNFALSAETEAVAARENAATGRTMSSLADMVKAIALNSKLDESKDFASDVQRSLVQGLRSPRKGVRDLGVKQAPFVVLIGAEMPSVLAEISFVTNRQEMQLLKSTSYRQRIADALLKGVLRYQEGLKNARSASE